MKKSQVEQPEVPVWAELISRGAREGAMIALFFLSVYLIVALASFDVQDPGWTHVGTAKSVQNAGGPLGAWFADVLMSLFGYLAFLFPILIAYRAWLVFKDHGKTQWQWPLVALRTVGFFVTMFAATGLAYLHFKR